MDNINLDSINPIKTQLKQLKRYMEEHTFRSLSVSTISIWTILLYIGIPATIVGLYIHRRLKNRKATNVPQKVDSLQMETTTENIGKPIFSPRDGKSYAGSITWKVPPDDQDADNTLLLSQSQQMTALRHRTQTRNLLTTNPSEATHRRGPRMLPTRLDSTTISGATKRSQLVEIN